MFHFSGKTWKNSKILINHSQYHREERKGDAEGRPVPLYSLPWVLASSYVPSTARPSSPPWWCTGTLSTWRRQNCRSWWCRAWVHPTQACIQCRSDTASHGLSPKHRGKDPLLLEHLQGQGKRGEGREGKKWAEKDAKVLERKVAGQG